MTSCGNDANFIIEQDNQVSFEASIQNQKIDTTEVLLISSLEDLGRFMEGAPENEYKNPEMKINTKANIAVETESGYDSYTITQENVKAKFTEAAAAAMGLDPWTVYIVDFITAKQNITTPSGTSFIIVDSPNCGYKPGLNQRGYAVVQDGNKFIMTTNLTHVKYDILGRKIDLWEPCTLGSLEWRYAVIQL